jgi:hypothetical protein
MTVNALWRRVYATGEAVGADATSASLPWTDGTNGVGAAKGYDDATAADGKSVQFTAADDSSAWIETIVTNACRVSFDWKCSCEPLHKGKPYDYLGFSADGVRQGYVCGETGWTNVTCQVTGDGEHILRWTFIRDEDGSAGENCAWLANVAVVPSVTVIFTGGGATVGTAPAPITAYADENVAMPGPGTLAWPKHHFAGWTDGVNVFQEGVAYAAGAVKGPLTAVWQEDAPETFGEYLNWPEQSFTTGGDTEWTRDNGTSTDSYCLRSGIITHSQTSRLETVVFGAGTIRFSYKVDGEIFKKDVYDGLAFCIDGVQQGDLMGENAWTNKSFTVTGDERHVLSWLYVKDEEGDGGGADCAWLDEVIWVPSAEAGLAAWLAERSLTVETRAANGRTAAECYALGLDPALATNDFRIVSIELVDGKPKVEWEPKTNRWTGVEIQAVLKGAERLDGPWADVPEEGNPAFRFFKVVMELP